MKMLWILFRSLWNRFSKQMIREKKFIKEVLLQKKRLKSILSGKRRYHILHQVRHNTNTKNKHPEE